MRILLASVCLLALGLLIAGCGGSGSGSGSASMRLIVADAAAHIDGATISQVNVYISRVEIFQVADNDATKIVLFDAGSTPTAINLLDLANQPLNALGSLGALTTVSLPAGHYTQMRIILAKDADNQPLSNVVLANGGGTFPLKVDSGTQTGFKLHVDMDLGSATLQTVMLDFNLTKLQQKNNWFNLTPNTLRVVNITQTGNLAGAVTVPAGFTPASDLVVELTLVDPVTNLPITDANGATIDAQVTIPATSTTGVNYVINGIPPGDYLLQPSVISYGTVTPLPAQTALPVTITSGQTTTQDVTVSRLQ